MGGYKANDAAVPQDACNAITIMCLKASRRLPLNAPCLSLRMHKDMPQDVSSRKNKKERFLIREPSSSIIFEICCQLSLNCAICLITSCSLILSENTYIHCSGLKLRRSRLLDFNYLSWDTKICSLPLIYLGTLN